MFFRKIGVAVLIFGFALSVHAQGSVSSVIDAYRSYKDVGTISVNVPTVVEMPFADEFIERFDFAVLDVETNTFEPHFFKENIFVENVAISASTNPAVRDARSMLDGSSRTYTSFSLSSNTAERAQITLTSQSPVTSSKITTLLDDDVALPSSIEIHAIVNGRDVIVVADKKMEGQTVRFPQTTSSKWIITFTFVQPLRISELRLNQDDVTTSNKKVVRFLAQPNHSYRIYFDPDRSSRAPVGEAGNLASAKNVVTLSENATKSNPNYVIADVDGDGVPDINDNCIAVNNSDQEDVNGNGRGDVCDDFDQDGLINSQDNCPNHPNRNQRDVDSDGIGNVCDGVESRITERHAWIPWVGIGFAAFVLVLLLFLTAKSIRTPETVLPSEQDENQPPEDSQNISE